MLKRTALLLVLMCGLLGAAAKHRPGAVFLTIWPGSRPTALGGSYTAIADDASAAYYNPGGLGFQNKVNLSIMHVNWLTGLAPDMYYEYLAVSSPFKNIGTFSFNGIYLTTGETPVVQNGQQIGTYTTFDFSLGLAYGRELTPKIGLGGGVKFIYSFLAPKWVIDLFPELAGTRGQAVSWAADAGVLYKPFNNFQLGLDLQNLGPPISFSGNSDPDPLPFTLRLGATYKPLSIMSKDTGQNRYEIVGLRMTTDVSKGLIGMFAIDPPEVDSMTFAQELAYEISESWRSIGLELTVFKEILTLRAGYFFDKTGARGGFFVRDANNFDEHIGFIPFLFDEHGKLSKVGVTFGAGIKYAGFQLDIGIDENIYDFPTTNRKFSLTYTF